jgi:hypothetical protein
MPPVIRSLGVLEDGMEHHLQALLALSITSVLRLGAWIWARRRLIRFHAGVDRHETASRQVDTSRPIFLKPQYNR